MIIFNRGIYRTTLKTQMDSFWLIIAFLLKNRLMKISLLMENNIKFRIKISQWILMSHFLKN